MRITTLLLVSVLILSFVLSASEYSMNSHTLTGVINNQHRSSENAYLYGSGENITIGNPNENSTYEIQSNLTVGVNQFLKFVRCNITVDENITIDVLGGLTLDNSSLSELSLGNSSHSINFIFSGTPAVKANFTITRSSMVFNGQFMANNSNVKIMNSTINSTPGYSWISYSIKDSHVDINDSQVTGLHPQSNSFNVSSAIVYSTGYPIAKKAYLKLHGSESIDLPITSVLISALVSGEDPDGADFLNLSIPGNGISKISLNSTGSLYNKTWENSTVRVINPVEISTIMGDLNTTLFYNFTYSTGSNLTLWNISVDFISSDIVDYLGSSSFNYCLNNTTFSSFNSTFDLSFNSTPGIVPFSGNHQFVLTQGSKLSIETSAPETKDMPFSIDRYSQVYLYGKVSVNLRSSGRDVTGNNLTVTPYVSAANNSPPEGQVLHDLKQSASRVFYLLSEALDRNGTTYYGDYFLKAYGYNESISVSDGISILKHPEQNAIIEMSLPELALAVHTYGISVSDVEFVNLSYSGSVPSGGIATANLELLGNTVQYNATAAIRLNQSYLNFSLSTGSVLQGEYEAVITVVYSGLFTVNNFSFYQTELNFTGNPYAVIIQSLSIKDPWHLMATLSFPESNVTMSCQLIIEYFDFSGIEWKSVFPESSGESIIEVFLPQNVSYLYVFTQMVTESSGTIQSSPAYFDVDHWRSNLTENITVEEKGLTGNSIWELYLDGTSFNESGSFANLTMNWNSKSILVTSSDEYSPRLQQLPLTWNKTFYMINFTEITYILQITNNLVNPDSGEFQVSIPGVGVFSGSSMIEISLHPGNYTLNITPPNGYTVEGGITHVSMEGNTSIYVSFTPVPVKLDFLLITEITAIAFLIAISAFAFHRRRTARICSRCSTRLDGKKSK